MSVNSQAHGDLLTGRGALCGDQKNESHPDNLLCNLRKCRHFRFLGAVAVAVGAGMEGSEGQGKSHDGKIRAAAWLHEDALGNPVRIAADQKGKKPG